MHWEYPLLLGFILLFGFYTTLYGDENYYVDFMGVKHHVMIEKVSEEQYDNDMSTNIVFLKYDDPWTISTGIAILAASIFVVFSQREQIQTFLQKSRILSKLVKSFSLYFLQNNKLANQNNSRFILLQKKPVLKINFKIISF